MSRKYRPFRQYRVRGHRLGFHKASNRNVHYRKRHVYRGRFGRR